MDNLIISPFPMELVKSEISATVKNELQNFFSHINPKPEHPELLSRKEAAKLLSISLPTLNEWTKSGLIKGYRIASRVRYKRAELETSLSQIKTTRR